MYYACTTHVLLLLWKCKSIMSLLRISKTVCHVSEIELHMKRKFSIRSKCAYTYLPFLVQGLSLCVAYNEILQLSFLLVVIWFLIVHMHRATIVYVIDIELQAGH
jgi:hypothetical protein